MLDCIIIGSGVAAVSAALTLQSNGKSFEIFGDKNLSKKIYKAENIRNYPGLTDVTGEAFNDALKAQLAAAKITVTAKRVVGVYAMRDKFSVTTSDNETYESRTVILACGVESGKQIDGEEAFMGRGVSYCATCDGFLYRGKTIAVLCFSKSLEGEIDNLSHFAQKLYLMPMYKGVGIERENIEKLVQMPVKIDGIMKADKLIFAPKKDGDIAELNVDGIFILKESLSPSALVAGLKTENGHVVVDRTMATNLKGLFAAGDCTGRPYQYAKAAGEGNVAAHSVSEYLSGAKE